MKPLRIALLALVVALVASAPASARDPGRWTLSGFSSVPNKYWQGVVTPGQGKPLFFSGFSSSGAFTGLHRTRPTLRESGTADPVIPASVLTSEGYNHVGDVGYQGGRVLLPLECFTPGGPNGGNTCGTGSIGVADPASLTFQYYVKLDPAEIPKAMWVEPSPDGQLLWTSSGPDLLAYSAADVTPANAAPGAAPIRAVRRLPGAVPPSGITGAAFYRGRLFLAGAQGTTYQVWSVDVTTGSRRLELELRNVQGEAEGLVQVSLLGSRLHFLVAPLAAKPTFGPTVGLLHFTPGRWAGRGLRVSAAAARQRSLRPRVTVTVRRAGRPVEGAAVSVAGFRGRTNGRGRALVKPVLGAPGSFAAMAQKGSRRGRSGRIRFGPTTATTAAQYRTAGR
jgi:hypothetical protein